MHEGSGSFGECHSDKPCLPPSCFPVRAVGVEAVFSKRRLPVTLSLFSLSSCHSDPFQRHAVALTSLPKPFPAICLNPVNMQHEADENCNFVRELNIAYSTQPPSFIMPVFVAQLKYQRDLNTPPIIKLSFFKSRAKMVTACTLL